MKQPPNTAAWAKFNSSSLPASNNLEVQEDQPLPTPDFSQRVMYIELITYQETVERIYPKRSLRYGDWQHGKQTTKDAGHQPEGQRFFVSAKCVLLAQEEAKLSHNYAQIGPWSGEGWKLLTDAEGAGR